MQNTYVQEQVKNHEVFLILSSVKNSLAAVNCVSHIFFFCKGKINYHMKSNLSLLLHISFYILFPLFFCVWLFPSKSSLKSCLVQLTSLFQRIISFHFLKKQKVVLLFLIIDYQPVWSIYKISPTACAIPYSSPFHTMGGAAPSPGHKSTRLLDLHSHLSCRHWCFCNQLNEHVLLRKLSKVNQCENTCATHSGHRHYCYSKLRAMWGKGLANMLADMPEHHSFGRGAHTRGIKPVMLEAQNV